MNFGPRTAFTVLAIAVALTALALFVSPWFACGVGCLIGAAAVAPAFVRSIPQYRPRKPENN